MDIPFLGARALADGAVTKHELRTRYRAIFRNVYLANDVELTAAMKAKAASLAAGPNAVLAGVSAAAIHGAKWLDPAADAVVVRADRHRPPGLVAYSYALAPEDICVKDGMLLTTPIRTIFDIGRLLPAERAVPIVDALLRSTGVSKSDVCSMAYRRPGVRGVQQLLDALSRADPGAETLLQSQVRMLVRRMGSTTLETQIPFYDEWGLLDASAHMGWRQWRVAVQCDEGYPGHHESQIRFQESLARRDWRVVWVTDRMMQQPLRVLARVRNAIAAARRSGVKRLPRSA